MQRKSAQPPARWWNRPVSDTTAWMSVAAVLLGLYKAVECLRALLTHTRLWGGIIAGKYSRPLPLSPDWWLEMGIGTALCAASVWLLVRYWRQEPWQNLQ